MLDENPALLLYCGVNRMYLFFLHKKSPLTALLGKVRQLMGLAPGRDPPEDTYLLPHLRSNINIGHQGGEYKKWPTTRPQTYSRERSC